MRRWAIAGATLLAIAAAGTAVWLVMFREASDPVAVGDAVAAYRAAGGAGATAPGPPAGVYVYATAGSESVDALLGASHDYPTTTTVTVRAGGCGLLLRWDALADRSTVWELCPSDGGWLLAGYRETHRFLGQTEVTDYRCATPAPWLPTPATAGLEWTRRCSTDSSTETAEASLAGLEPVEVDGEQVESVHLAATTTLAGRTRGSGSLDVWLRPADGLLLRLVLVNDNRTRTSIGDVHYEERVRLDIQSLRPRT